MHSDKKTCSKCHILKPLEEYYTRKASKDGHRNDCICCNNIKRVKWSKAHPGHDSKKIQIWNINNRMRRREITKKWDKNNSTQKNEAAKRRLKIRYESDCGFRLKTIVRARIRDALKKTPKNDKTMSLVGCTIFELKKHLESKFTTGMSWESMGEWHVDHVIPCASFDLSNPDEQQKCFHYSNLQPLWAEDNRRKGAKLNWE